MKIDHNDPRITAFALGELTGDDAIELARAVRSDERVGKAVEEVRETARLLGGALSPNGAEMLTGEQLATVRSAGSSPVITDIASARIPFWKKPAVVATGVAAAVAATLFMVGGKKPGDDITTANQDPEWSWTQVDTRDLTAPVSIDTGSFENKIPPTDAARAVSAAISDDTDGFRDIVRQRIESCEMKAADSLPELDTKDWQDVSPSQKFSVPVASGAASWPWVKRHIMDAGELPPHKAVRIEEMINHFSYSKPNMIKSGGLAASIELCHTPWNPLTHLLAVHVKALPGADVSHARASLVINSARVKKLRLLGYANAVPKNGRETGAAAPAVASRTRGNYAVYELLLDAESTSTPSDSLVSLTLGGDDSLTAKEPKSWIHASQDMRFASMIAATGMILSDYPASGGLDAARLASMVDLLEKTDGLSLAEERKEAIKLVRKAFRIVGNSP